MSTSPPPPPPALTRSSLLLRRFIYNSLFEESRISNILFFAEKRLVYYTSIYRGTYALFFWLKKKRVLNSGLLNPFGTWFILITVKRPKKIDCDVFRRLPVAWACSSASRTMPACARPVRRLDIAVVRTPTLSSPTINPLRAPNPSLY